MEVEENSTDTFHDGEVSLESHTKCSPVDAVSEKEEILMNGEVKNVKVNPVFVEIDESEILCDESLVKEAKVSF